MCDSGSQDLVSFDALQSKPNQELVRGKHRSKP